MHIAWIENTQLTYEDRRTHCFKVEYGRNFKILCIVPRNRVPYKPFI